MSQNYGAVPPSNTTGYGSNDAGYGTSGSVEGGNGTAETAKQEAVGVKDTAQAEAGHVVETAKQEVSSVAHETKAQARQVYAETRRELSEQAATQQQRVADGLRSIGDELQQMARGSENPGMATEFVEMASTRLSDASSWLSQRDPGSLVHEVKTFARRKPGLFIAGALVAGIAAGRLTRALAEGAKEEHAASGTGGAAGQASAGSTVTGVPTGGASASGVPAYAPPTPAPAGVGTETPMYDRTRVVDPLGEPGVATGQGSTGEARDGL
ncbi:hypothetical protein [Microbacterium stercoris]|uniref:ATP synthase F0 subunit B n=1 Tax=Microbacterium stercoris TaxID=2820289 RepID=A0A939TNL4_9MICO|nr:hypothetical protein [Microbacterium stercoris]MBO3662371.1 hypothetical protein [Microbacterium stercoris]MBO3664363.1 hypothetical protein [Microbacterium stercoris]